MRITLALHIFSATLGLLAGYVALYSAKGATVHRKSGILFVYAMLVMAVGGMILAMVRDKAPDTNIPAGLLTSYLVITALTTVRPLAPASSRSRWLAIGAMLVALGIGLTMLSFAVEAIANGGRRHGMPVFPYLIFVTLAFLGVAGDVRVLRFGARTGGARLARHLWRMSMALFIAALSASVQLARILRTAHVHLPRGLLFVPILLVLVTMFYWLWRVRRRRTARRLVGLTIAEVVPT